MKISIFPKAKALPNGSDEKRKESANCVYPAVVDIPDVETLIDYIQQYAWSPSVFKGTRCNDNFKSADFMVIDVDNGLTMESAEEICMSKCLDYIIGATTSHTDNAHKFRLIFPLVQTIKTREQFDATWDYLHEIFPQLDIQCSDPARFYFSCKDNGDYCVDNKMLAPVELKKFEFSQIAKQKEVSTEDFKDKELLEVLYNRIPKNIPESIDFFLKMAYSGLEGMWNSSLSACVFTLSLQGIELEKIEYVIDKVAPEPLDSRDLYCINRNYKSGQEKRREAKL